MSSSPFEIHSEFNGKLTRIYIGNNRERAQDAHMSDQALRIRERIAALQATNPTDEDPLAEARAEQAAEIRYAEEA